MKCKNICAVVCIKLSTIFQLKECVHKWLHNLQVCVHVEMFYRLIINGRSNQHWFPVLSPMIKHESPYFCILTTHITSDSQWDNELSDSENEQNPCLYILEITLNTDQDGVIQLDTIKVFVKCKCGKKAGTLQCDHVITKVH